MLSALIDNFEDQAVQSLLFVVENLLLAPQKEQMNEKPEEESKTDFETVNVMEYSYDSKNPKHKWKKREVGLLVMGLFAEDISMFKTRKGSDFNIDNVFEHVILSDLSNALIAPFIKGRSLWCAAQMSEMLAYNHPLCQKTYELTLGSLPQANMLPVRLSACRALVRFTSKVDTQQIPNYSNVCAEILIHLTDLLNYCNAETLHIPIEAITFISRLDSSAVSKIAPHTTPKLLELFKLYHNESLIGPDLLDLFK